MSTLPTEVVDHGSVAFLTLTDALRELSRLDYANGPFGCYLGRELVRAYPGRAIDTLTVGELTTLIDQAGVDYNAMYARVHAPAS